LDGKLFSESDKRTSKGDHVTFINKEKGTRVMGPGVKDYNTNPISSNE
jgi:hypothetical protein